MIDDGVPDLGVGDGLDVGEQEPDLARGQFVAGRRLGRLVAEAFHFVRLVVRPQADLLTAAQAAFDHAGQNDDAAVRIEPRVEDQRAKRRIGRAFGRRHQVNDVLQNLMHARAGFGAGEHGIARIEPDDGFDLLANALGLRGREVDLVDDRNDFQIVMEGEVSVGEGLSLHALRSIDHQQRALAGLQAARNLVGEIDVAGRIDQVELVEVAVVGAIVEADRVGLNGDAALALEVHRIEHLLHHFALGKRAGDFEQAVGKRRLAVVDVRNDREIADEFAIHARGRFS